MSKRKKILAQMFDVRPLRPDGSLDFQKIQKVQKIARILPGRRFAPSAKPRTGMQQRGKRESVFPPARQPNVIQLGKIISPDHFSVSKVIDSPLVFEAPFYETPTGAPGKSHTGKRKLKTRGKKYGAGDFIPAFLSSGMSQGNLASAGAFALALLVFSLSVPGAALVAKGLGKKNQVAGSTDRALVQLVQAKENISAGNFGAAATNFEQSREIFASASEEISEVGGIFSEILRFIPGVSKIATANYLIGAGEDLSAAGEEAAVALEAIANAENPLSPESDQSLAQIFLKLRDSARKTGHHISQASEKISKTNLDDLPDDMRPKLIQLKDKLPILNAGLRSFVDDSEIMLDVLGYNGPRKFLFLFQNNQEMRATGGFIGSYGILDISGGKFKKLFVDDIYNPDGQLKARVIPPEPIQKMSAVWTMHDANWFPDFPTSAEKIAWFYEKTGGPTVDGVIAVTPVLIQQLLGAIGPIEMPDYETVVDEHNFVEKTQTEVETEYDREENKPKKFIADLTPKILEKAFDTSDMSLVKRILPIFGTALKEKHLLVYSKNYNIQKLLSRQNWSGEILDASEDYLAVINSNINGYKTDGVIEETIEHTADIQPDGTVIDEVVITRKHNGGNEDYDWWNKVNSDYVRVYVPEGSRLLEVSGQTREFVSAPLDYATLGFRQDPQLVQRDGAATVDEASGTKIYSENRKTVFANWTYVSPGETMQLRYKYQLPFKLAFNELHQPADSFSVLYQKQSGSPGSKLVSKIKVPDNMKIIWRWPDDVRQDGNVLSIEAKLDTDRFAGIAAENAK